MKKIFLVVMLMLPALASWACPACEKQQPKLLRGISHGAGPESDWDMVIVWFIGIIVVLTLVFSIKFLVKPGEKSKTHIKRFILSNEQISE
ncbi:hypothetical protein [Albibacterium profundi]|uniref:Uncharacterized protein n=1 Tax=Albibacterium profundi TaxID=3134906 RepID=A0ABV5CA67_9SPHI